MDEQLWSIVTIGGPILFILVVVWAMLHNRTTRRQREAGREATKAMYREGDAASDHNRRPG